MRKDSFSPGIVFALIAVLLSIYVANYFALLDAVEIQASSFRASMQRSRFCHYRAAGPVAKVVFSPIHWLDRQLRPTYWFEEITVRAEPEGLLSPEKVDGVIQ
jgi:hypothetical protein